MLRADRLSDGSEASVDADQALRASFHTPRLPRRLSVSQAELVSTGPNGTYPAYVISR